MQEGDGELVARLRICLDSVGVGPSCLVSQAMTRLMKKSILTQLGWALALLGSASADGARSAADVARAAGLNVEVLQSLDLALQRQVDKKNVSGVIAMIGREGKIGYYETFGKRVIEGDAPMTRETLFRIYSMTKPIVAVTAMSIWEEGKFKLDDPISKHLPEWEEATVQEKGGVVPAKTPITARHLMTHSSGITYGREGVRLGEKDSLADFSGSLAKRPLKFHPGSSYHYGYSIDVLGRFLEAIEGKSLDLIMRERVLDPLEMKRTEFWVKNADHRKRVAMVYRKTKKGELGPAMRTDSVMVKPPRMMGGQGLMSTAGDYARFCEMLLRKGELDGKRVLKRETVELMCRNHLEKIGKVYGLGGTVNGKGLYSWGGAAGTKFWVDTENDHYAVFMIQTWGYKTSTFNVFKEHAKRALTPGTSKEDAPAKGGE